MDTPAKPLVLNPPLNITLIKDAAGLEQLRDFFNRCQQSGATAVGWDIETNPLKDYFWRKVRTIQFGNQTEQYVIDLLALCGYDSDLLFKAQGFYGMNMPECLKPLFEVITPVLCSRDWLKVGVNLGFEYQNFYWQFGIRTFNFYSCDMAERCIWAGAHSMKDYSFYSMEEMMARYFQVQIDKSLQESFTLEGELTWEQVQYAALDTRTPGAIRSVQALILDGETFESLSKKGDRRARFLQPKLIDPILTGDNLTEIVRIENDAIGAFEDMHVHGERLDRPRWLERVAKSKIALAKLIHEQLDPIFLPIVGSKVSTVTEEDIAAAEAKWKAYNNVTTAETDMKPVIRAAKKNGLFAEAAELEGQLILLVESRKATKEKYKAEHSEMKKRRTAIKNLAEKCEGLALINYGSDAQLLRVLQGMKGLKSVDNLEDETLEKYEHIPVMAAIRKYHGLKKEIGTYGDQWVTEWKTKPCKEEGWLHPGDGRLHCVFNQYDAETGRSTSEKPNGQNLPQDKEVRSCFIADPPNESIRISVCCDADTQFKFNNGNGAYVCTECRTICDTKPEEYVIVTADMSGAELRIIAELAGAPVWVDAFARGEDVHSVGTELLYPEKWPALQLSGDLIKNKKTGEMTPYFCEYFKRVSEEDVAANPKRTLGDLLRQKCECPEHKSLRDDNKATNFLLAYGGGPGTLAARIKRTLEVAKELMAKHRDKNGPIWDYLERSGMMAKVLKKAFDMYGRRRVFPEPTWERATRKAKEDREEKLRLPDEEQKRNIENFTGLHGRKPDKEEKWILTHRLPTDKEISNAYKAMHGTIERQGKNHSIQGTNATIAKLAMGAGYCSNGKPFLWHTLPQYKARLIKFVHDELVVQCPKRFGKQVAALIGDAFKRAAAEKMKKVVMEFDFNIALYWKK